MVIEAWVISDFMKKILILFSIILANNLFAAQPIQCNFDKELGKNIADKLISIREKTINTCLKCAGESCDMKIWPSKQKGDAMVCQRLFCTPQKIRKVVGEEIPTDITPGKTKIEFTYRITMKGKVQDVNITSVVGVMNKREAYRWVTGVTRRTLFVPLEVEGKAYEIINLPATMIAAFGPFDAG